MKISILSAWNSDSGSGMHAELLGREWIKMGHKVSVFSFIKSDFHGKNFLREDELYVTRCFGTPRTNFFDPRPIVKTDMDILVVEDLGMLPKDKLAKIFPLLREKAKTINIIHDNKLSPDSSFYQFRWNKVIVFDERYKKIFENIYKKKRVEIIPYPCSSWRGGDRDGARKKLNLPKDKKIIFIFGWWTATFVPYFSIFKKVNQNYPLYILVISKDKAVKKDYLKLGEKGIKIDFREKFILPEDLYDYLHAADVLVFGHKKTKGIVVCSTALMCIGAGTPIVAPDSNFFETFNKEVFKYKNEKELKDDIIEAFKRGKRCKEILTAAKIFVEKNNPRIIAKKYISLFKSLLSK